MKTLLIVLLTCTSFLLQAQSVSLKSGMKIKKSVKIRKGTYALNASTSIQTPLITISGKNIVVDFAGAILQGSNNKKNPDEFYGVAVVVQNSNNVTIKNLTAKGYKIALIAKNVGNLTIENCDFSYNYRKRLNSTQEKEDLSDWMSYHQNDKDEWLRYGAAMYLRGCANATIRNCKVTGGQNALMMTECNNGMIYNNNFSFNSGIGLGMYRCSNNKVLYNKINFNVRGYSHGVYQRGQDSAGILVYEQSNNNLFYKNAVTHSGDGFFLWAGQTTINSGQGGCNDNVLLQNDFSYAPTNGIEVTFSRNIIIRNRIFECDYGLWGGYSHNTRISDNQFRNNRIAIAIEHGQENRIHHNLFAGDKEAIKLWARKEQPADWGYSRNRDTRSRNYIIASNSFNENGVAYNLNQTDSLKIFANRYNATDIIFKTDSTVTNIDREEDDELAVALSADTTFDIPEIKNPANPFTGSGKLAGRKNILINEWGPYNFQYPLIWHANPIDSSDTLHFNVFGPGGTWKILSFEGVKDLSVTNGTFTAAFIALRNNSVHTDIQIVAEYTGPAFKDQFGNEVAANKPFHFAFRKFFQPINFIVNWYAFDSASNPVKDSLQFLNLTAQQPFKTEAANILDYSWWGGIKLDGMQHSRFLTVAEGSASLQPGTYELGITWDDAVRLYVDGRRVVDEWKPSSSQFDESQHKKVTLQLSGQHNFRIEHAELGGFATLSLKLNKLN